MKKYTFMQRKEDVVREWHHYDAEGQILGRLAVEVAKKLMGKDKLTFTPQPHDAADHNSGYARHR